MYKLDVGEEEKESDGKRYIGGVSSERESEKYVYLHIYTWLYLTVSMTMSLVLNFCWRGWIM